MKYTNSQFERDIRLFANEVNQDYDDVVESYSATLPKAYQHDDLPKEVAAWGAIQIAKSTGLMYHKTESGYRILNEKNYEEVMSFFRSFRAHTDEEDVIVRQFRAGYCWHWAHLMLSTFDRGQICWAAPFAHIVWVDIDNTPYDAEGMYYGEAFYYIPTYYLKHSKFGDLEAGFKHLPGKHVTPTRAMLRSIMQTYCSVTSIAYDPEVESFLK